MATASWSVGRETVDKLLAERKLTRVAANRPLADGYLRQARQHVGSARTLIGTDAEGAFQLAYDAARKSLAAVLVNQGLRASGAGAHATTYESVRAQLGQAAPAVFQHFTWMRKLRNTTEYPDIGDKPADNADARDAIGFAQDFILVAENLLDQMPPY